MSSIVLLYSERGEPGIGGQRGDQGNENIEMYFCSHTTPHCIDF